MLYSKEKLDGFVLDLEFLLISVIQGIALTFLVTNVTDPLMHLQYQYWIYIFSGFLFILLFWSQAIIHALSFIDWPLNLTHGFFYFLASFFEVLAFTQITHPLGWFIYSFFFFIIAGVLYIVDLRMILERKKRFVTSYQRKLFQHLFNRQKYELFVFIPSGILYSALCVFVILHYPQFFIEKQLHIILGILQGLFSIVLLVNSDDSFKKRRQLISDCLKDNKETSL